MSVCVQATSGSPPPKKEDVPEIVRRSANYHPCVWGDHFLAYSSPDHAVNMIMLLVIYRLSPNTSWRPRQFTVSVFNFHFPCDLHAYLPTFLAA